MNAIMILLMLFGNVYEDTPLTVNPDPEYVPESYDEWLLEQPELQQFRVTHISGSTDGAEFLMIFQEGLTDSLEDGYLDTWITDISSQGLSSQVVEMSYCPAESIRSYLQDLYAQDLEGAVIIGNFPPAWIALDNDFLRDGESFPADYFLMDLDGIWEDNWIGYPSSGNPGSDGMYDTFSGNLDPEIYVGRIKVNNLTELGDPVDILNEYLLRNHEWRVNGDTPPLTALCYVDDDWEYWAPGYQASMENLYSSTELVSEPAATNGTDYLENRLPGDYVWISPFVHSNPGGHYWAQGPVTQWDQLVPALPQAHFYNLFACSNCRFTTSHNMGSVYALCTQTGLAAVGSTKSGSMLQFTYFYQPLGNGASLGEAYRDWWEHIIQGGFTPSEKSWHLGMVVLGDPTLIPAMHMLGVEDGPQEAVAPSLSFSSNPCRGSVTVYSTSGTVELYDICGRLVLTGGLADSQSVLDLSGLDSGVYIARVDNGTVSSCAALTVLK